MLLKLSIVGAAFYFIYQKLANNITLDFPDFLIILSENNIFSYKTVSFLLVLSISNWFFEILKWKTLINPFKNISLKQASEQTLGALTASLFTPNRIGEYGAKALFYRSDFRKKIVLINLISNLLQLLVTIILGLFGLFYVLQRYNNDFNIYKLSIYLATLVLLIILIVVTVFKSKFSFKGFSFEKIKHFLSTFPKANLWTAFGFSGLRYIIFSFQFYVLLKLYKINMTYFEAIPLITSMYLLASIIPSIFILDVLVKGSIAVYLFALTGVNELIILSIITLMWLLNFVLPSILGSYYVLRFNSKNSIV
ncbi:lysylphosphatidylglycerol synthase domain-containing protein [Tamlana sp. I1]|uniref:lysylphosphatidylglycerol synthase domain-containing protein n=1 Tax=Tamlana sp. I1 TaxID=2762061 RepID=UPI001E429372|nr:lysylphosphatidylglycerol synthase domain-containing protein [Tamlana sp. I1]